MTGTTVGVISTSADATVSRVAQLVERGFDARALTGVAEAHRVKVLVIVAPTVDDAVQMVMAAGHLGGARPVVVALLEDGTSTDRAAVMEAGADECLTEPFSDRELGARLGRLIGIQSLAGEAAQYSAMLARDLAQARRIQEHILPLHPPVIEGVEIVAQYLPAAQVGGDFFDIIPLEKGRVGLFMADVAGHGVGAALNTMLIKSQLVIWARPGITVTETLGLLNNYLYPLVDLDYATAVYAVLDRERRELEYALAGHPSPMLMRKGEKIRLLDSAPPPPEFGGRHVGLPLGLFDDCGYVANRISLEAGDRVLLYTDGLIEWPDGEGEQLGVDGACDLLEATREEPLEAQVSQLIAELDARRHGAVQSDDVNLLGFAIE